MVYGFYLLYESVLLLHCLFHLEVKQCAFVGLIGKDKGQVHRLAGITEAMSNAQTVLQEI